MLENIILEEDRYNQWGMCVCVRTHANTVRKAMM